MKKLAKILVCSLLGVLGSAMIVLVVLLWLIFTPARLTPLVRNVADQVLLCDYELGDVELTFFSTFPEFGLRLDHLCLRNSFSGAASDTLLCTSELLATLDVQALLKQRHLHIHHLSVQDAQAYIFFADSVTNLDILALPSTSSENSAMALPFDSITVEQIALSAHELIFHDLRDTIQAAMHDLQLQAYMHGLNDVAISLSSPQVYAQVAGEVYADNLSLQMHLPLSLDADLQSLDVHQASLQVNEFALECDGVVSFVDSLTMQLTLSLADWHIQPFLQLLPASLTSHLHEVEVDGYLSLQADVAGALTKHQMPIVDAAIKLQKAHGSYVALPYQLHDVNTEVDAHIDINNKAATAVTVHSLSAKTQHSSLQLKGQILQPLTAPQLQLSLSTNAYLPEFADMLPKSLELNGRARAAINIKAPLSDLVAMQFDHINLSGECDFQDLTCINDSLSLAASDLHLEFELPNTLATAQTSWARAHVQFSALQLEQTGIQMDLGASVLDLATSNLLDSLALLHADMSCQSMGHLQLAMDTISLFVDQPSLHAQLAGVNLRDTNAVPDALLSLSFASLQGDCADKLIQTQNANLELALAPSETDATIPVVIASVDVEQLHAQIDSTLNFTTQMLAVAAMSHYDRSAHQFLLKWNPQLQVNLIDGDLKTNMLPMPVFIPHIDFAYNNREFHIEESRVQLGNSDFHLSGDLRNMAAWLNDEGNLLGDLNFVSTFTDVNELMTLFSASVGSEEATSASANSTMSTSLQNEPFLVPTNVNVMLNTQIDEARVFEENLRSLHGKLYVNDGTLILEEMGFICKAAQLQLTAMYRTPRRNHIYVGLDYHMIDIKIEELVHMLPQLDTIVPMLNSFRGEAEFHLAAETYLTADYKIKPSSLRGACSLAGKDLVVLDGETFTKLSKKLMFNKKTENKVDSISAEMTVYKKEIDLYPLCVTMDNYKVALGGRHNLDMTFDYDVNVLSPIYLGVNVSGTINDLNIKLTKCKYAKDFRPVFYGKTKQQSAQLRSLIRESMRKNLKLESQSNNNQ